MSVISYNYRSLNESKSAFLSLPYSLFIGVKESRWCIIFVYKITWRLGDVMIDVIITVTIEFAVWKNTDFNFVLNTCHANSNHFFCVL